MPNTTFPHAPTIDDHNGGMAGPKNSRSIVTACFLGAAVILAYWCAWFTHRSAVAATTGSVYFSFENAFPAADGWLALCLVGAGIGVLRGWRSTLLFMWMGAGAGAYLFFMDVLYDLEHGIWGKGSNGLVELLINVVTAILTIVLGRWSWVHRAELQGENH